MKKETKSNLFHRVAHDSVRAGFDFETLNIKNEQTAEIEPHVTAWGISFASENWNSKNPIFKKELLDKLLDIQAIHIAKVKYTYLNNQKEKTTFYGVTIQGVDIVYFLLLLQNCLKNITLVGNYNSSYDNTFIFEQGKKMKFFNHIEIIDKDENLTDSKTEYLKQLKEQYDEKVKGKIEILKCNGKYYQMAWQNDYNKIITFDDDWLLNSYALKIKGEIIGLNKRSDDVNVKKCPYFKTLKTFLNHTLWVRYLQLDCIIVQIYNKMMITSWAEKNEGYNNVGITQSSNAYKYAFLTFTKQEINKLIDDNIISNPYRRKTSQNKKSTKMTMVCDVYEHEPLAKYDVKPKIKFLNYNQLRKQIWNYYFPTDWLSENNSMKARDILDFKIGGMVHLNHETFQNKNNALVNMNPKKIAYVIAKIDINSSYPSVMASNKVLCPYGRPLQNITKIDINKYQLIQIKPKYNIKVQHNFMPFLREKKMQKKTNEWVHDLKRFQTYFLDSNMWSNFVRYYKKSQFEITIIHTFKTKPMSFFFGKTIQTEYENKSKHKNKNEALYQQAKIILNSIYGKFATNYYRQASYYDKKNHKWVRYDFFITGKYVPVGIAILNAARIKLCDVVNDKYKYFKYCDTDSLCILVPKALKKDEYKSYFEKEWNIKLHATKLGAWDLEGIYKMWGFFQPKSYLVANPYNRKSNEGDCIRKRAGYRWGEQDENDTLLPMYGTRDWKRHCTKKQINEMQLMYIDGCELPNQTTGSYIIHHGRLLQNVTKVIEPIYNSYLHMSREKYFAQYVIA